MNLKRNHILLMAAGIAATMTACESPEPSAEEIKQEQLNQMKSRVEYLASDSLEGRETGTAGEALAAQYLVKEFEALGLQAKG